MSKERIRQFGGKAAYIAFSRKLGLEHHADWEELTKELQEAWIAAAHEACMLQWIIETNGNGNGDAA